MRSDIRSRSLKAWVLALLSSHHNKFTHKKFLRKHLTMYKAIFTWIMSCLFKRWVGERACAKFDSYLCSPHIYCGNPGSWNCLDHNLPKNFQTEILCSHFQKCTNPSTWPTHSNLQEYQIWPVGQIIKLGSPTLCRRFWHTFERSCIELRELLDWWD